jgi:type IV conjugative transfer system coupling protein TraD
MSDVFNNITRGGQIQIHQLRMLHQIATFAVLVSLIVSALFGAWKCHQKISSKEIAIVFDYSKARLMLLVAPSSKREEVVQTVFVHGQPTEVKSAHILASRFHQRTVRLALKKIRTIGLQTLWCFVGSLGLVLIVWLRYGASQKKTEITQGRQLVSVQDLRRSLERQSIASDLSIADKNHGLLPFVKNRESSHMLVAGTTGAGKSNLFNHLLPKIRTRKNRAIIVDVNGQYVAQYYDPSKDFLINPYDTRSVQWNIWDDCTMESHYQAFAASLIPEQRTGSDDIWTQTSRLVLVEIMKKLAENGQASLEALMDIVHHRSLGEIEIFLKNTPASKIITTGSEKTSLSVLLTLTAHMQSLSLLSQDRPSFSLRHWINHPDHDDSWLFITARSDQIASLKPLMSALTDTAIQALLSQVPGGDKKTWFVLDELPKLNRLPSLSMGLAESRKYGGCFLVGIQSMPQLTSIYGTQDSASMLDMFNSFFFFRCQNPHTTEWISKTLGMIEQEDLQEHMSYGASSMKDGVSFSKQKRSKPLVPPSDIANLPDLACYVKFAGFDVTKVQMVYRPIVALHEGFSCETMQAKIEQEDLV